MTSAPPSLAAMLDQRGPLPWREAARLTAQIARALDRLHARGEIHGGIEPLTILFVGGAVRLADPLPLAERDHRFMSAAALAGQPVDRREDFFGLGRTMLVMLAGTGHSVPDEGDLESRDGEGGLPRVPRPIAAILARLTNASPDATYASGNDIAAALELAIAASEGLADNATVDSNRPPSSEWSSRPGLDEDGVPPAATASRPGRRASIGGAMLMSLMVGLLLLVAIAVVWMRPSPERVFKALPAKPEVAREETRPGITAASPADAERTDARTAPSTEDSPARSPVASPSEPVLIEEVLASLPGETPKPTPRRPIDERLRPLVGNLASQPCARLEVEPGPAGSRLLGRTANNADRRALLREIAALGELDAVDVAVEKSPRFCRLYDILATSTELAVPRLSDLFPRRRGYRLVESEPLVVRVRTPSFQGHLHVDYFTADAMVVHLEMPGPDGPLPPPREELLIGDPRDGQRLAIAAPFGEELVLTIVSHAPLFEAPRPQIEPANTYLDALASALAAQAKPPLASTMAIRTVPKRR